MIFESPYPSIDIPDVDLWGLIFEREVEFPEDKVIYLDPQTSRSYTFRNVKDTAISFGRALRTKWNWQKGDVLGLYSPNCIDTPAVVFGAFWANGVVSPANPAYSPAELGFQLKNSKAKALVTQAPFLQSALEAAKIAEISRDCILLIGDEENESILHLSKFIQGVDSSVKRIQQAPSDLALIPYSSGTTGLPKGVKLTHRNLVANLLQMVAARPEMRWNGGTDGRGDTLIGVLPFYHIYGFSILVQHPLWSGARVVVLPRFVPEVFLTAIQQYKVTLGYVVPPILLFLAKSPLVDNYDLSSLKQFTSAAAPLSTEIIQDVYKRLKIPVEQAFGMSELSPGAHIMPIEAFQTHIGSVGRLYPNMRAKIVSESGLSLPTNTTGELWLQGPNVFAGYLGNDAATANCMTPDGYFKTGDIGHVDGDGYFFITDRKKELIKYKGFQVAPAELESLLLGNEMVADACVVGIQDDEQATELPLAFVVKSAHATTQLDDRMLEQEIVEWVAARVSNHKRLRGGVRFVDEIPKSTAGKILRRVLRDGLKAELAQKERKISKL